MIPKHPTEGTAVVHFFRARMKTILLLNPRFINQLDTPFQLRWDPPIMLLDSTLQLNSDMILLKLEGALQSPGTTTSV